MFSEPMGAPVFDNLIGVETRVIHLAFSGMIIIVPAMIVSMALRYQV